MVCLDAAEASCVCGNRLSASGAKISFVLHSWGAHLTSFWTSLHMFLACEESLGWRLFFPLCVETQKEPWQQPFLWNHFCCLSSLELCSVKHRHIDTPPPTFRCTTPSRGIRPLPPESAGCQPSVLQFDVFIWFMFITLSVQPWTLFCFCRTPAASSMNEEQSRSCCPTFHSAVL